MMPAMLPLVSPLALASTAATQGILSPTPERVGVVASFLAKPGKEEALRAKLLAMIAPTRAEKGCVSYDVHVDQANPAQFYFIENWKDEGALAAHLKTPHFTRLIVNGTPGLIAGPYAIAKSRILSRFEPKTAADPRLRAPSSLTLLAFFSPKQEKLQFAVRAMAAMLAPTRAERGNISYDLYQTKADGNVLYFAENWESKPALKRHMALPHFVQHIDKETAPALVVPWTLITLKRISPPGVGAASK